MNLTLKQLLQFHHQSTNQNGLKLSLGDNYLYHHNPLFKNIRDTFLKNGFTFTTEDFCNYTVLPYASLKEILKQKKVPYYNNVSVLENLEKNQSGFFQCHDLVKVKPNYTLHESSHCLVDSFIQTQNLSASRLSDDSQKAFKLIMAEAFANTIESLANVYNTTAESRLFYEVNSYMIHIKKVNQNLTQTQDLIGLKNTFQLVYISYLFSNCLYTEPNQKSFLSLLDLIIQDTHLRKKASDSQAVKKAFNHAFELNLDFRIQTTSFYCRYLGMNTDIQKLLNIDILKILSQTNILSDFFKKFEFLIQDLNH